MKQAIVGFVIPMLAVGVVMTVSTRRAGAHELKVAIAVPGPAADTRNGFDGMRLGIDQSPDVGHAPGSDAGDHLGGVDVNLVVLETLRIRSDKAAAEDAEIVVVLDPDAVTETARALAGRSILLIAVLRDDAPAQAVRPDLMIVLRPEPPKEATPAAAAFEAGFAAAYLRPPTKTDAIGFDVAQVLDVLLTQTDGAEPDTAAISAVESEIAPRLTATRFESQPAPGAAASDLDAATRSRGQLLLLALGAASIVTLTALFVCFSSTERLPRSSPSGVSDQDRARRRRCPVLPRSASACTSAGPGFVHHVSSSRIRVRPLHVRVADFAPPGTRRVNRTPSIACLNHGRWGLRIKVGAPQPTIPSADEQDRRRDTRRSGDSNHAENEYSA